jgi:DNA-binding CsgD family transcriptional regulator
VPLGIGGLSVRVGDHIAQMYTTRQEMIAVLGPFVAIGLSRGDRCAVYAPHRRHIHRWLTDQGVDVRSAERSGQLVFPMSGKSAPQHAAIISELQKETAAAGYRILRLAGDAAGTLNDYAAPEEMLLWEAAFDAYVRAAVPTISLCHFDVRRLRGDTLLAALKVHPICIVGETAVTNPFYRTAMEQGLTPRELDVLRLIAAGLTDGEIAAELKIGKRTVQTHVRSILTKMGVGTRTGAGVEAVRAGIVQ